MRFPFRTTTASATQLLSALHGWPLDLLYALLVHKLIRTGSFFHKGWGDLRTEWLVDKQQGLPWPPPDIKVAWRCVGNGTTNGVRFTDMEGSFQSPCTPCVWDALPTESTTGRVRLLAPKQPSSTLPCVVHLAGTGDQGFGRRLRLGHRLLKKGIASIVLESPFYGARRPSIQNGCKLGRVSDLLTLGRATIEESLCLLHWADRKGFGPLGVCGLSMGGVHACMVASLYPGPLACSPLLAPRSAAVAFCEGALQHGILDWRPLAERMDAQGLGDLGDVHDTVDLQETMQKLTNPQAFCPELSQLAASVGGIEKLETPFLRHLAGEHHFYPDGLESDWTGPLRLYDAVERYNAQKRLQQVLEAFTDVTKFPRPQRPDAAVFVAATNDAYVSPQSVVAVHQHWPGSEIRWVQGGHVSSFVFHAKAFCNAIHDSLSRLMHSESPPRNGICDAVV